MIELLSVLTSDGDFESPKEASKWLSRYKDWLANGSWKARLMKKNYFGRDTQGEDLIEVTTATSVAVFRGRWNDGKTKEEPKLRTFVVEVERVSRSTKKFTVEAQSPYDAEAMALDEAPDMVFQFVGGGGGVDIEYVVKEIIGLPLDN